jgi:hypothetical protein
MAKGWKATTRIEHGREDGTRIIFEPGDLVTDLKKDDMAKLWEAGALEETNVPDTTSGSPAESTTATESTVTSGSDTSSSPSGSGEGGGTGA